MSEVSQMLVDEQSALAKPDPVDSASTLPPAPSSILAKPHLASPRVEGADLPDPLSEPLKPPLETGMASTVVQEVSLGPASQEAAALLLGIGTAVEASVEEQSVEPTVSSAAIDVPPSPRPIPNGYLHTPPNDDRPVQGDLESSAPAAIPITGPSSPVSKPARAPSPTHNAIAGPSRHGRQVNDNGKRPSHWMGENNDSIRCICGLTEDDGYSIQCESCYAWQHMLCFRIADESVAPEVWYCELCQPRPVDAPWARQMMSRRLDEQHRRQVQEERVVTEKKERPKARSGKPKRTRLESVSVAETEEKDGSPGAMGPPAAKPRKRGPKRTKQSTVESTPGPSSRVPMPPLSMEEGFYRAAWKMEYIPIDDLIFRNDRAKRIYHRLLRDHTEDEEDLPVRKRPTPNPSGLPSPTETGVIRLSPDRTLPRQNFGILAPPLPLIPLSGTSLADLSSSWEVKPVEYGGSFLPPRYVEESTFGTFGRPTIYAVYADEALEIGSFVGECTGELIDTRTYRSDPINQYGGLGLPKPYVRSIGPPVNLLLDARGYGNDLRFVRSGCHPNVVIRPIVWSGDDTASPELRFGLFAARLIDAGDELVLAWEWDDKHVVHTLNQLVFPSVDVAGPASEPSYVIDRKNAHALGNKYEVVLTHLFSTFSSCACQVSGNCAIAQLRHICESLQKGHHRQVRIDDVGELANLGLLIGKARGWRLRELEEEEARRRRFPEGFSMTFDLSRAEVEPMDLDSGLNSQWTSPGQCLRTKKSVETLDPARSPEAMDVDIKTRQASTSSFDAADETPAKGPVSPVAMVVDPISAPMIMEDEPELEPADEGNETDHTSDTEPKTHFTSESESEEPPAAIAQPVKASAIVARKARRVLSPVPEAMQVKPEVKSVSAGRRKPSDKPRKGNKARASKSSSTTDSSPAVVRVPARRRGKRVVSSEDEMEVDTEPAASVMDTTERAAGDVPKPRPPTQAVDQHAASLPEAAAPAVAAAVTIAEPGEAAPPVEPKVEEKEPTPPPKEPTPPPEPPKKVSLAEYLKTHKIKKDSATVPASTSESMDMPKVEPPATPASENAPLPGATTPAGAELNRRSFLDFLPTSSKNTPVESPRPLATPSTSASFVPRSEYFPPQGSTPGPVAAAPSSSFVPRPSSSFVPRQASISSDAPAAPQASSSFAPRPQGPDPSVSPSTSFAPRPESMPPFAARSVEPPVAPFTPGPSFAPRPSTETPTPAAYGQDNAPGNYPSFSPYPPRSSSLNPPTGPTLSPQRTFAEMPPALDRRDPPPHVNGYDRKDSVGGGGGGYAPPPVRAPPTAPRGPKGGPSGANNWPPASPRSASGALPMGPGPGRDGPPGPPSGPRGFGGGPGPGPGFRGRGMGFMRGGPGFRGRGRGM